MLEAGDWFIVPCSVVFVIQGEMDLDRLWRFTDIRHWVKVQMIRCQALKKLLE